MSNDFDRYSCQLALPGFNEDTQQKLKNAKVLLVGAGGLGCPAALYLAAAGVGTIGIADNDVIAVSNLHRQVLYTPAETGLKKAVIAAQKLQAQNPAVKVLAIDIRVTVTNIRELIVPYDIIVDCTDNFDTKYLLNDACVLSGKPMVYAAIYQYEGQLSVFNVNNHDGNYSPNFRDLFPAVNAAQIPNCAEGGVMPTLAGIMGCLQANEVIKYLTGQKEILVGKLMIFDVQTLQSRIINLKKIIDNSNIHLPGEVVIPVFKVEEFLKIMDSGEYTLIDVRTNAEHNAANIGGINIPLVELGRRLTSSYLEKPVIFYCATGNRSEEAVRLLKSKFPTAKLFSLEGGIQSWNKRMGK